MARAFRQRGVLLTTYGMVQHNAQELAQRPRFAQLGSGASADDAEDEAMPLWDFMILDEVATHLASRQADRSPPIVRSHVVDLRTSCLLSEC